MLSGSKMKNENALQYLKRFKNDKNKKIVLLFTPNHGNLGDSAITLGELKFFKQYFGDFSIYEFTLRECQFFRKKIAKHINENDIVTIHGGGFIGSLWKWNHNYFVKLLKTFSENKIFVFPQTIFFYEKDQKLKEKFLAQINSCKDLTIFVRDFNSYKTLEKINARCKFKFTPDIALFLKYDIKKEKRKNKVLVCMRRDREKNGNNNEIFSILNELEIDYDITDMIEPVSPNKYNRAEIVAKKIEQFTKYKLVLTDRLHGMIFATLAETPCIAFNNASKKVEGVYQWIKNLGYVKLAEKSNIDKKIISEMLEYLSNQNATYDNSLIMVEFEKVKEYMKNLLKKKNLE